jgi:gamma-butyrobetaine dioxygenase
MAGGLPTFDYAAIMNSKAGLRDWLEVLRDWGVALVKGAPSEDGEVKRIAERIGALRATNFGTVYNVVTTANPNASADTEMALEPHTDLANWRWPTDVQFLFCLASEAVGGSSILVDGFRVAEELRHREPDAYEILTTRPIDFRFHDESCDIRHRASTIELDGDGRVTRVRFNNWLRDTLDLPESEIERTYGALRVIWRYLRDPAFQIRHRLEAGCMLSMDNNRVLHGRDAFDCNTGRRHFQGGYVDRDLLLSRLRLLDR